MVLEFFLFVFVFYFSKKMGRSDPAMGNVTFYGDGLNVNRSIAELYFTYCCIVWDSIGETLVDSLQKLQNRAARCYYRCCILETFS